MRIRSGGNYEGNFTFCYIFLTWKRLWFRKGELGKRPCKKGSLVLESEEERSKRLDLSEKPIGDRLDSVFTRPLS